MVQIEDFTIDLGEIEDEPLTSTSAAVLGVADIPTLAPTPRTPTIIPIPTPIPTQDSLKNTLGMIPKKYLAIGLMSIGTLLIIITVAKLAKDRNRDRELEV